MTTTLTLTGSPGVRALRVPDHIAAAIKPLETAPTEAQKAAVVAIAGLAVFMAAPNLPAFPTPRSEELAEALAEALKDVA